jgi:uracil-DNA glycosylase family 4
MTPSEWNLLNEKITQCDLCPRLISHCKNIAQVKRKAYQGEDYWGKPVANFGPAPCSVMILGLAPAAHGANRTGRMFTGDRSGDWLYRALFKAGFANQALSISSTDGLVLNNCMISAVCHCAPPDNKPLPEEIDNCLPWLEKTIEHAQPKVFLALGALAWNQLFSFLRNMDLWDGKTPKFEHGAVVRKKGEYSVFASYHPSQQNTFTKRLTEEMFDAVFNAVKEETKCFESLSS